MRVIVTASRTWTDRATIYDSLHIIAAAARASRETLTVAHGCADGGDQIADDWVRERARAGWPVVPERHPADWKTYGRRRAGFVRNSQMCLPGADACLAFVDECVSSRCKRPKPHGSHGATQCADFAEYRCDIPTTRVERFTVRTAEPIPDEVA